MLAIANFNNPDIPLASMPNEILNYAHNKTTNHDYSKKKK